MLFLQATPDTTGLITDLLKTSPITGLLFIALYMLWKKLSTQEADTKAVMDKHDAYRADQQATVIALHERSITASTGLGVAIDNLRESTATHNETTTAELRKINSKLERVPLPGPRLRGTPNSKPSAQA